MAERQGFEPWIEFPLYTLSKRAPSTTRPSLRVTVSRIAGLLLDDRAVALADFAPSALQPAAFARAFASSAEWILGGSFFIDLDSPARSLIRVEIPVLHLRAAVKHLLRPVVEGGILLDAEVVASNIERDVGAMADWRDVAGAVPGR